MKGPRIPVAPLAGVLREYINRYDTATLKKYQSGPPSAPTTYISEAVGINKASLDHIVQGKTETILFDLADKLVCATVGPAVWYSDPEMKRIYESVDLSDGGIPPGHAKCLRFGCEKTYIPAKNTKPGRQRYCSHTCKNACQRHRAGKHRNREYECMRGHTRTEENTRVWTNINGKLMRRCKDCERASYERRKDRAA